mgnify:FL=1
MKISIRKDDLEIIKLSLFEYAGICDSEADISYENVGSRYKQEKNTEGYKLARRLEKIINKLNKEMEKNGKSNRS